MRQLYHQIKNKANLFAFNVKNALDNSKAEGYVDTGVKILIAVVIGTLLLAGLYALFNSTILPNVTQKIQDLFNFNGSSVPIVHSGGSGR